ncbi:unnamed protein product [Calicophoron daubneyi]|uniref:Amine oxidase domain-containing protein n=1 Tax=Calicophoron daubneyi TaxID=300641 RepID=A0AAV2TS33_CALDB
MPRGRGSRRVRRPGNVHHSKLQSVEISTSDEDAVASGAPNAVAESSRSRGLRQDKEAEGPVKIEEDEEEDLGGTTARRLTEGEIDVDDGDSMSAEEEPVGEEAEEVLTPYEKAARICRLPSKELCSEEILLFPFLENASRPLRESYLCVRNLGCLLWSEDPCVQVTPSRLYTYVTSNISVESMRPMVDAGLTAPLPPNSSSSVMEETTSTRNKSAKESHRGNRHLATWAYPSSWSPWGTPAAKANLEKLCYYAVLFLERYGHVNFGLFRILAAPLTHVTLTRPADELESPEKSAEQSSTLRRSGSEKALPPNRRSGSTSSLSSVTGAQYPLHIIVLGAGVAGLMVARQLTYFGARVTILESRDRVGGRIWTHRKGDVYSELGAMVVTGLSANPVAVLAKQIPLCMMPINTECSLYDSKGRMITKELDEKVEEEFNRLLGTAAYLCHTKCMDSITLESGEEKSLSLGEVLEMLIRYQERHKIQLKITHRKLILKLLERKNELLAQITTERQHIENAYERWQTATARANPCSVVAPRVECAMEDQKENQASVHSSRSSSHHVNGGDVKPDVDRLQAAAENAASDAGSHSPSQPPPIFNVSEQFEVRRLLSELHEEWKKFDPLQTALARVNRQLEILLQSPPKEIYLTEFERRILDWHFANLEFANATELQNLSLRHWDQDDVFELNGEHCVIRDGYGQMTDALALAVTTAQTCSGSGSSTIPSGKQREGHGNYGVGSGHIELKSSVKRVLYNERGVRVDALNAAFSQDDLIEHEADLVVCTLPLGVLKESVSNQRSTSAKVTPTKGCGSAEDSATLTKLSAPMFQPPLPSWKVESIKRLGFGVLNKVVLIFEKFFWDRSQNLFGHVGADSASRGELFLFWSITDRPVLIALVAGRAAVELESEKPSPQRASPGSRLSTTASHKSSAGSGFSNAVSHGLHEPIVGRAMHILRTIFGQEGQSNGSAMQNMSDRRKTIPNPIDAIVTRWQSDPDSRGSYSYVGVGATGTDYDILGEPVPGSAPCISPESNKTTPMVGYSPVAKSAQEHPRVFFAGEHTCRCYPATVHGALLSGLREAARVANAYFPGPTPVREPNFKLNSSTDVLTTQSA